MDQFRREQMLLKVSQLAAQRNAVAVRFSTELQFAEALCELNETKAPRWRKLIAQACAIVESVLAAGKLEKFAKAVEEAEAIMSPIGKAAKGYTIHCIGHAHIDMNWMWSWPETVSITNDTFLTVLKLMDEFPDFRFSQSQASVYAICRDYNPDLLAQIGRRIAEGRWEVTASQWVEGEKNLACGEALARHLLYTRQFMQQHFNLAPEDVTIDWEGDMFGHAHTIPSILSRGGVKHYYMCRPGLPEKPRVLWWQGPDGSRVLGFVDYDWYNGSIEPHLFGNAAGFFKKTGIQDYMWVYGVGDHGGGPVRRDILRCREMNAWPLVPNLRMATTKEYFAILEKQAERWPVIDGELNFEFTGCYTTQTAIKKANRYGENYCLEAEMISSLAQQAVGRTYPTAQIRESWLPVLFGQFHDILPGSGVHWTREHMLGLFQEVAAKTSMVKLHAMRQMAAAVDTSFAGTVEAKVPPSQAGMAIGAGVGRILGEPGSMTSASHVVDGPRPFVVFNPTTWERRGVVQASVWDTNTGLSAGGELRDKKFIVRTLDGQAVPAQSLGNGHYWGHNFVDLAFPVQVGSLGYSSYVVEEGILPAPASKVRVYDAPPRHEWMQTRPCSLAMENEFLTVEFDMLTGGVKKLIDKGTGLNLADEHKPMGVLEFLLERSRGMSAWVIGDTQVRKYPLEVLSITQPQSGPYVASVAVKVKVEESTVTVTYTLRAGEGRLEIGIEAYWVERGSENKGTPALRMLFPLAIEDAKAQYEIPFGSIERNLNAGQEVPTLRWADVTGTAGKAPAGITLLNDCKYGYSLDGSTLTATLIRSSFNPDPLPEVSEHSMKFAICPHGKKPSSAELIRLGAGFNHPLAVLSTDVHKGTLPSSAVGITAVTPDNVILSSIRKAQDDDGFIVHVYETAGKQAAAKVAFDKILMGTVESAVEVDFMERPIETSTAKTTADGFGVTIPAHGIAAVRVKLTK